MGALNFKVDFPLVAKMVQSVEGKYTYELPLI